MARTLASSLGMISLVALAMLAGCTERPGRPRTDAGPGTADGAPPTSCVRGGPTRVCIANLEISCNADGAETGRRSCVETGQVCAADIGCAVCVPNRGMCAGNVANRCRADGSGYDAIATCDAALGQHCDPGLGVCTSPCDEAARTNSYIGCEYWPVTAINTPLDRSSFTFAVVVSNPQTDAATVTVTRGGASVATRTVAPGAIETIELPWVEALQTGASAVVSGGAYRVVSSLPVTVYQFNPLEFQSGSAYSYTNDASLLLPSHVLTPNYVITSRPTMMIEEEDTFFGGTSQLVSPGFFAVVAAETGTTSVRIAFSADVLASSDGSVRAFRRGESGTFMLQQGDVLQILSGTPPSCDRSGGMDSDGFSDTYYCAVGPQWDLTGTEIRASAAVGVVAGHDCAFVPRNRWACDHLEENLFPEESWGRDAIVSTSQPLRGEPNVVRILSGRDGNAITFDPASVHAPVTLSRGQFVEFESTQSFRILATEAIQVAQFLVGQDYAGMASGGAGGQGDPSMSLAIPTEQYRTSYAFLAPTTYTQSYVNVTAPMGASVTLDGVAIGALSPIGASGFGVARVPVAGGAHNIAGDLAFGIVVYGYASYTSYMYPGGLDLEDINIPF